MGRRPTRWILVLIASLCLPLGSGALRAGVATAEATGPVVAAQAAPPPIRLVSQTTWWRPEQPFEVGLAVDTATPGAFEVAIGIHPKLPTRIAFTASAAGRVSGRAVEVHVAPLADAPVDDGGRRLITFTPTLQDEGVYPVRVELRPLGGGTATASFVTHLVAVPADLRGDKLAVAAVVPVHAPPAIAPDGRVAIDDDRAELLSGFAAALAAQADVALTLAPTPETVEALAASPREQDAKTLADLAAATTGRKLLGGHFVPTNLTTMIAAGLEEESTGQINRGTGVLRSRLGGEPITAIRLIDERLSDEALAHLQDAQDVDSLVVPESFLEPIARNTTLTASFLVEGPRGRMATAMADAALAGHFAVEDPVLGAQRLLADLAQLYNDDPSALRRGVVVSPSRSWRPEPEFVDALLAGLRDSPILRAVDLQEFFAVVDAAASGPRNRPAPLVRRIGPPPPGTPGAPALPGSAIRTLRRDVDAFASAIAPDAAAGQAVVDRLDRTLSSVVSVDLRVRDRTAYLAGVREQLDTEIAAVAMPQNRSITLTAREGDIPVTITSGLGYPVRVLVRVTGPPFEFPDGNERPLVLERDNTTSRFAVRAPSSGSFRIRVQLLTPDGHLQLTESRFTVRSTAISGVGTALSIGAGLFLVVWWGNHLRGRRSKRLIPR